MVTSIWALVLELNPGEALENGGRHEGRDWSLWFWVWSPSSEDTALLGSRSSIPGSLQSPVTLFLLPLLLWAGNSFHYRWSLGTSALVISYLCLGVPMGFLLGLGLMYLLTGLRL